jgi:hypothetical protein
MKMVEFGKYRIRADQIESVSIGKSYRSFESKNGLEHWDHESWQKDPNRVVVIRASVVVKTLRNNTYERTGLTREAADAEVERITKEIVDV